MQQILSLETCMAYPTAPSIVLRAYQLWEEAGRPEGRDEEFYFEAEEELRKLLELECPQEPGEE
jgi:hypothetical protein